MAYLVVWQPGCLPAQPLGHLGETLGLDEVVEGEGREHGTVSVDVGPHQQGGSAHAVERDLGALLLVVELHIGHEGAVGGEFFVALKQQVVGRHLRGELLGRLAVLPAVEVVRALSGLAGVVLIALVAVGHDNGLVVRREVLDERGRGLDDVAVEPEHPRRVGPQRGEEERVARLRHGGAPHLLILHLVPLRLVLRGQRRVEVLPLDDDPPELVGAALLCLGDLGLQGRGSGVALLVLGDNEAEGDELVGVAELQEVVPVVLVEAGHGRQDQDGLAVGDGVLGDGDMV